MSPLPDWRIDADVVDPLKALMKVPNEKKPDLRVKLTAPKEDSPGEEELPPLIDSTSDSAMGEAEPLKLEISSSGEEDTDDEVIAEKQQAKERTTGQLDFDYEPVLLVQNSGQMKNQVANMAKHLWEVLQEDYQSFGNRRCIDCGSCHGICKQPLPEHAPLPNPHEVWWTEPEIGKEIVKPKDLVRLYYDTWQSFNAPSWSGPLFPRCIKYLMNCLRS